MLRSGVENSFLFEQFPFCNSILLPPIPVLSTKNVPEFIPSINDTAALSPQIEPFAACFSDSGAGLVLAAVLKQ